MFVDGFVLLCVSYLFVYVSCFDLILGFDGGLLLIGLWCVWDLLGVVF